MPDNGTPSLAYTRFAKSMVIGFDQWHGGVGCDVDALSEMTAAERAAIEGQLVGRLSEGGDWRDVEALLALGTPAAMDAVRTATRSENSELRNYALGHLAATPEMEADFVQAVER